MCVPLLSPRETNGACAAWIFFSASTMSLPPATFAGSLFGPDQHEVVVHDREPLDALALGQELLLGRLRVDENDIGIAAPREIERLAGAERHDAHLDSRLLFEDGQEEAEEPRLLGRRRRGHCDEAFLRLDSCDGEREQETKKDAACDYHGSSPSRKRAASGEAGCLRNWSAAARSTSRP